jgi:hypothetical protein
MPVILSTVLATLGGALGSMAAKMMTQSFFEWAILKSAEALAKKTTTPHDDEFVKKAKELIEGGKK